MKQPKGKSSAKGYTINSVSKRVIQNQSNPESRKGKIKIWYYGTVNILEKKHGRAMKHAKRSESCF